MIPVAVSVETNNVCPFLLALDYDSIDHIPYNFKWLLTLGKAGAKIGHTMLAGSGLEHIKRIGTAGDKGIINILLDLKFHDTPKTVELACKNYTKALQFYGLWGFTLHVSDSDMLKAAVDGTRSVSDSIKLFGITVLTSLNQEDLTCIGIHDTIDKLIVKRTEIALDCGLDGVVCPGDLISEIKTLYPQVETLTPGTISSISTEIPSGQKHPVLIDDAIKYGGDYFVIGRSFVSSCPGDTVVTIDRLNTLYYEVRNDKGN